MYFKKFILMSLAAVILCIIIFNVPVFAADDSDDLPTPELTLYPVSVKETQDENGRREVIKTYELDPNEKPDNISRESFTRDDWLYKFTDMTKNETVSTDTRNHTETVTLNTDTNDTATILKQFPPKMLYSDNDGYDGVLSLDISSIKVETAGTKSTAYTVTATREYHNLPNNDTSAIPKSITDNGRTLIFSDVDWNVQNYITIDYDNIPDSYIAVATYTGTAYRTVVTGYITTAEYIGFLAKNITDKTVYEAYFTGTQIIPEEITTDNIGESVDPMEETESESTTIPDNMNSYIPLIITGFAGTGLGGGVMYYIKNKTKKRGI